MKKRLCLSLIILIYVENGCGSLVLSQPLTERQLIELGQLKASPIDIRVVENLDAPLERTKDFVAKCHPCRGFVITSTSYKRAHRKDKK